MEHSVSVNVLKDDKSEEEVEVYFETDDFDELADKDKKVAFIKEQAKKQYEDIKKVYFARKQVSCARTNKKQPRHTCYKNFRHLSHFPS